MEKKENEDQNESVKDEEEEGDDEELVELEDADDDDLEEVWCINNKLTMLIWITIFFTIYFLSLLHIIIKSELQLFLSQFVGP